MRDGSPIQKCYRCGELKPVEEFSWRRKAKGQRDSFCRPCRSAYGKEHYEKNRERYIEQAGKRRLNRERTLFFIEFFKAHPCVDCGEGDPVVLDFDHVGDDKLFNVGQAFRDRNWQSILDEIEKCEVVCANCHRRRIATRNGHMRLLLNADASEGL